MPRKPISEETREKLRAAGRRRVVSDETRAKLSASNTGHRPTPETRAKMAAAKLGSKQSAETIARRVSKTKGKKRSEDFKEHLSEIRKGKKGTREAAGQFIAAAGGYVMLTGQYDHPLAGKNHGLLEHRKVLYNDLGPGPHPCYWGCGKVLGWDDLQADHLDGNPVNNDLENLVPSCGPCNSRRANDGNPIDWKP